MSFKKVNQKQNFPELEEQILKFWRENKIFEKSVEKDSPKGEFSFYDGPPFATGLPHYGHLLAGTIKDVIPRFKSMQGYKVERIWGWDTHGLPIENIVEQELDFKTKTQVEEYGIDKFNEKCRSKVLAYADEWKKIVERTGRWVDMENAYLTMDPGYMESVWHVFKELWDKKLIYEGHRVMPYCPRCATPLSNFEVGQGYKDKNDKAITVKFRAKDDANTYLLAWTTTPWTLPGNLALAVGKDIDYVEVKVGDSKYILAKDRLSHYEKELENAEISREFKGSELLGKKYEPIFDYYKNPQKAYEVISGDFVSTADGTGIVHIAPAFGEDDYRVAKENGIDFFMPVDDLGEFTIDVPEYAGKSVVESDTNADIIKDLGNKVVKVESITHSYPHCWRCKTPLIYRGVASWFVAVDKVKDKMLAENNDIYWLPNSVGAGRFANLIENAPDWSISRNRFWGTPIPVWKCEKCEETKVVGSIEDLRGNSNYPITKITFVRHGEAENNLHEIRSSSSEKYPLTEKGRNTALETAKNLKDSYDVMFCSPVLRAKETGVILIQEIGYDGEVIYDKSLSEFNFGDWVEIPKAELKTRKDYQEYSKLDNHTKYDYKLGGTGDSRAEMVKRISAFFKEIVKKYPGKNILVVSHGGVLGAAIKEWNELNMEEYFRYVEVSMKGGNRGKAEVFYLDPKAKNIDIHKHYVDEIEFSCDKCSSKMKNTGEVLDCWFESGSMPYASIHYPFENVEKFDRSFPADFIAEGIDQTRGWFYSLLVLSTALFDKTSYKSVVVNGTVLAEGGQKMSKSLRNYPDPMEIVHKYGADAMRYYLMSSPAVKAEDLRFAEKGVDEVVKKIVLTLWNSYSFFITYASIDGFEPTGELKSENNLDFWIISEFNQLVKETTEAFEAYDLVRVARSLSRFIDDLSNWYIRRSRRRFWKSENDGDKAQAYETLYYILVNFVKILAPLMPFVAEEIYQNLRSSAEDSPESVHLSQWPTFDQTKINEKVNSEIHLARQIVELGLKLRAQAGINVRQPLAKLTVFDVNDSTVSAEIADSIKEELNVKDLDFRGRVADAGEKVDLSVNLNFKLVGPKLGEKVKEVSTALRSGDYKKDGENYMVAGEKLSQDEVEVRLTAEKAGSLSVSEDGLAVLLDVTITEDLASEGLAREIVRQIQDLRKKAGFEVADRIEISYQTSSDKLDEILTGKWQEYIKNETLATTISSEKPAKSDIDEELTIDSEKVNISLTRM